MDSMVTARMPQAKKEAGNTVLNHIGISPSKAINELYDYLIRERKLPFSEDQRSSLSEASVSEAFAWVEAMSLPEGNELSSLSDEDIKAGRIASRGLLDGLDL